MSRLPVAEPELGGESAAAPPTGGRGAAIESLMASLWDQLGTLGLAILVALGIRTCAIEPFRIPSESMLPTLLVGDHLFVNKFLFGARVPFSDWRLPAVREPRRGDVVVFTVARHGSRILPADERPDLPQERFVKRVVGLPGDRIRVDDDRVFVNGNPLSLRDLGETLADASRRPLDLRGEGLGDAGWRVLDDPAVRLPASREITVPPHRYFMLGDNRDHSNDSRSWGTVHRDEMQGPAFLLYWSWDWEGGWLELARPATWWMLLTQRMRWERVGAMIE